MTSDIKKEYNKIVRHMENDVFHSNQETSNQQLDRIGAQLFGSQWGGVYAEDEDIKINKNKMYYIVNTDKQNQAGTHWVGLYFDHTHNKLYVFDTFDRQISKLLHDVEVDAKGKHFKVNKGSHMIEQADKQNDCGQRSMSWLQIVKKYGINKVKKAL